MDSFIQIKIEEKEQYSIRNEKLTRFLVQPGFVENVQPDYEESDSIIGFLSHSFSQTKEYLVISWNGIPFRWSYARDLPFLLETILGLLENSVDSNINYWEQRLASPTFKAKWTFTKENEDLIIEGEFTKVTGAHQRSLNAIPVLKMNLLEFQSEWKLLMEQMIKVLKNKKRDKELLKRVNMVNKRIPNRAVRYQYE
jgi:hypothetical protein